MADDKQKQIDDLYAKYQKTLELLNDALDQLAKKPKEVEVEKVPMSAWDFVEEVKNKVKKKNN